MAGMKGFEHKCNEEKVVFQDFKCSLADSPYSHAQVSMIWDFYVTHSFAGVSGQEISLEQYGWDLSRNRDATLKKIESRLMETADIKKLCCIRASTIKDTLSNCSLSDNLICVSHPRIVLMQKYFTTVDENESISFAGGGENRITCLFRHIRNSLAHGNTYFFTNGNVLLEDKDGSKITARMLLTQKTLLDWIHIIDFNERFYRLVDVCKSCPQGGNENGTANS